MTRCRCMGRRGGLFVLVLCAGTFAGACGGAQGGATSGGAPQVGAGAQGDGSGGGTGARESYALAAAAIVSPAAGVAFVSERGQGIAAVRLADGEVLWRSDAADRPLAAGGGVLIAQEAIGEPRHHARVAVMAAADGNVRARSEPIVLPDWVAPWPWYNGDVTSFDAAAELDDGTAIYRWDARTSRYSGGVEGSPESGANARSVGAARVELGSGHVTMLDASHAAPLGETEDPPAFARLMGSLYSGTIPFSHAVIDGALVATRMEERDRRKVLVLVRFDPETGDERSKVDLTLPEFDEMRASSAVPRFSEDGRHLVITRLFMGMADFAGDLRESPDYTRSVYELATGRLIGEHSLGDSPEPYIERFVVAGDLLVHVSRAGTALIGTTIDGTTRFTHPLRVTHRHSFPAGME